MITLDISMFSVVEGGSCSDCRFSLLNRITAILLSFAAFFSSDCLLWLLLRLLPNLLVVIFILIRIKLWLSSTHLLLLLHTLLLFHFAFGFFPCLMFLLSLLAILFFFFALFAALESQFFLFLQFTFHIRIL